MKALEDATPNDVVYMDPPWQGTSTRRDSRYAQVLDFDFLIKSLRVLNDRNILYLLSFDGKCGDKEYGRSLPDFLKLHKVSLNAGRSSQATLLGRNAVTVESLYISPALMNKRNNNTAQMYRQLSFSD
jgi:DNA adenine methylase